MLLKFFKRPLPVVLATIIIVAILLWVKSFISELSVSFYFDSIQMPLYSLIFNATNNNIYLSKIVAFIVMLLSALYLIQINTKFILIKYRSYLPALLYIILSSSFLPLQRSNPAVFASLFLIIAINYLFSVYEMHKPLDSLFKSGIFVSFAMMFYFPSVFYIFVIFIAISIIKTFNFRDWIAVLAGFIAPWFFYFFYQYLVNGNPWAINQIIETAWNTRQVEKNFGLLFIIFYSFNGLLFLISVFYLLRSFPTQKINIRKFHTILIWFVVISFFVNFLVPFCSVEIIYLVAFPVSFIASNYLTYSRSRFWPEFFLVAIFIIAVVMQFY